MLDRKYGTESCFYRRGKILLKSDTVPTIFLRENREGTSFYLRYIFLNTLVKIMSKNFCIKVLFFLFQNNVFSTAFLCATVGEERCSITESQTGKCTCTCKTACELKFAHCYLINFTYATCKVTLFIRHFLTSPILFERINLGFFTKEDF